jgi:hypothetical protein
MFCGGHGKKYAETVEAPEMAKEIGNFQKDFERKAGQGYIIHPGQMTLSLGKGVVTVPLANL